MIWRSIAGAIIGAALVVAGMQVCGVPNDIPLWRSAAGLALVFAGVSVMRAWR